MRWRLIDRKMGDTGQMDGSSDCYKLTVALCCASYLYNVYLGGRVGNFQSGGNP